MLYTIDEVSRALDLPKSTIRYYEKEELLSVERSSSGFRRFSEADLGALSIVCMLKETGMPLQDIRSYLALHSSGDNTRLQRLELFLQRRAELSQEIQRLYTSLAIVDQKILWYQRDGS